ncbi:MAG: hypothetical protein AAFS10_06315 [Myxococcota bacterium]
MTGLVGLTVTIAGLLLNEALGNITITIEKVGATFLDRKGRRISIDASTLLNPAGTLKRLKDGDVEVKLKATVRNKNPIAVTAERVDYNIIINDIQAARGRAPAKGKPPITVAARSRHTEPIAVRIKTTTVFTSGFASILKGGTMTLVIQGTVVALVAGLPVERPFEVTHTQRYGPDIGSLPIPVGRAKEGSP